MNNNNKQHNIVLTKKTRGRPKKYFSSDEAHEAKLKKTRELYYSKKKKNNEIQLSDKQINERNIDIDAIEKIIEQHLSEKFENIIIDIEGQYRNALSNCFKEIQIKITNTVADLKNDIETNHENDIILNEKINKVIHEIEDIKEVYSNNHDEIMKNIEGKTRLKKSSKSRI